MPYPRNIVFILTDAQHHQWLNLGRGGPCPQTPNLDRFAQQRAVVFDRAFTVSAVCQPSRTAMMSGRYPIGNGVVNNNNTVCPQAEPRLGRLLESAGYTTGYFGKTHFAGNDDDLTADGWQHSFTDKDYKTKYLPQQGITAKYPDVAKTRPARYWKMGESAITSEHHLENVVGDKAAEFIENHHDDQSFALCASFIAPHSPFNPPSDYAWLYEADDMQLAQRVADEVVHFPPAAQRWIKQNQKYLNDEELRHWLAIIFGMVTLVDRNVGKILNALQRHNLFDDTLVIFTSDHGDFATRFGILGKSWCMTDDLLRVPLLVHHPQATVSESDNTNIPRRCSELVQTIDLTATMLSWAGVDLPRGMDGKDISPLLGDSPKPINDYVFAFNQAEDEDGWLNMSAVQNKRWKLVHYTGDNGSMEHLFDLDSDPHERRDRSADPKCAAIFQQLRTALLNWHVGCSGHYYNREQADFWETCTAFYDETKFTGQRLAEK